MLKFPNTKYSNFSFEGLTCTPHDLRAFNANRYSYFVSVKMTVSSA